MKFHKVCTICRLAARSKCLLKSVFEMCERDERMMKAFPVAGMVNRVSEKFLEEIRNHKNVIYISGDSGNLNDATHIVYAAQAILKTGGQY